MWAGILILFAGVLDNMDGAVARMTNRARPSGALLDSVVDRYSEIVVFFGFLAYFYHLNSDYSFYGVCLVFLAISGSVLVSYIRARAEGLGIECKVGIMQRLERICLITIGILAQGVFQSFYGKLQFYGKLESEGLILIIVFLILTIGTHLTAAHRLIFCYRQLNL
ncbi:MAG: CDP-alcohol phosphatidyltransferase family protein [Candidatus Poribacteria bacterium]|nr:CDP-alcohol phosphatidyltransferase family protein [Candidatus Poribacteria bacterium]